MTRVLVVGVGLAGTIVANELATDFEVVAIDRGPASGYVLPDVQVHGHPLGITSTFCYGEGGSTNLWHNGLIELISGDLHDTDYKTFYEGLDKWTNKAASLLGFEGDFKSERLKLKKQFGEFETDSIVVPRFSGKLTLKENVDFRSSTELLKIEKSTFGYKVLLKSNGIEKQEFFEKIVLSAGGLNTPTIINKVFRHKEEPISFIDHPMGFVGKIRVKPEFVKNFRCFSAFQGKKFSGRHGIRFTHNGLQHIAYFRPCYSLKNSLAVQKYKSLLGCSKGFKLVRAIANPLLLHPDVLFEIFNRLFGRFPKTDKFSIWVVFEQKNKGKSFVNAKKGKLNIDWNISEIDNYRSSLKKLATMLTPYSSYIEMVQGELKNWLWSAAHYSGGVDDKLIKNGVELKDHDNVFVADASVIREHSYANTGLTIGKIALEVAHRVRQK